ncbi:MAG: thiol-disulfide oxidoreductase DCC family protein [Hyphomicrobiaceae bacterium]
MSKIGDQEPAETGSPEGTGDKPDDVVTHSERAIWLYDGLCGFCHWSVHFLLAHERAPSSVFVAIQSRLGRKLADQHGIDPDTPSSFLFIDRGRAFEKSDGVIALSHHLRWPWRALKCLRIIPKGWRDRLYDVVARNRFRILGRKTVCELPPPQVRTRFTIPE